MRNITTIIQDKELPIIEYTIQQGSESFFLNNTKKPEILLSHGIYRFYQDNWTNRQPLVFGSQPDREPLENEYIKYYLSGQNVSLSSYITNFKESSSTYAEVRVTYKNPVTSLYYFTPSVTGFGNIAYYNPLDNFNLFVCLSTTTSVEMIADEYKIFIPITLSYTISTYNVNYASVSSVRVNLKTTNSQTISTFTLSASEARSIFSNTTPYSYTLTYLGLFPPLCASLISIIKSFK